MAEQTTNQKATSTTKAVEADVQKQFDAMNEKGYLGTTPDKTPNENYTVAGVVAGKPTPENNEGRKERAK